MPTAFTAKVTKSTNRPKLCTLTHKLFYWVVIFSKQQHCTPQIKCWLNINPASSSMPNARSKDIGQSGVSNTMLTRFKQSRPGEDYGELECISLSKGRSHNLALINSCYVGPVLLGLRLFFFFKWSQKSGILNKIPLF